ncbi:unnamed protein product [Leptosia nina]|uniref:Uncharacterized protein n=1 Tax=Leptosia nina TaxID=320188 RepID=A0AAV1IS75_9NEOP
MIIEPKLVPSNKRCEVSEHDRRARSACAELAASFECAAESVALIGFAPVPALCPRVSATKMNNLGETAIAN